VSKLEWVFTQSLIEIMKPEEKARQNIDKLLEAAGWAVQDYKNLNFSASQGIATLLRLPTGVFYAQGVKANVLFFDRKPASATPWTKTFWIYDLRTNKHFTLKENPLRFEDFQDFIKCYNSKNRHNRKETDRFKPFKYEDLIQRDKVSLDIFWLKDESLEDSDNLPAPGVLALEIVENLEAALDQFRGVIESLNHGSKDS
jgi:type I restriction enzyme M protein